jgi:hypothetical protein
MMMNYSLLKQNYRTRPPASTAHLENRARIVFGADEQRSCIEGKQASMKCCSFAMLTDARLGASSKRHNSALNLKLWELGIHSRPKVPVQKIEPVTGARFSTV